jgi:hypothetical protein
MSGRLPGLFKVLVKGTSGSLVRSAPISVTVRPGEPKPDTVPPQITITFPSNSSVLPYANVTVQGNASDNVAIQTVELSTDNVTWLRTNGTATWSANLTIEPGTNTIYARATDTAGNRQTVQIRVFIPSAGGLPPRPPADTTPLSVNTPVPLHLAAILFGVAGAVEALLFVYTRRKDYEAMDEGMPAETIDRPTTGPLAFLYRLFR